jgi:Flp pilus assembly protein TadD
MLVTADRDQLMAEADDCFSARDFEGAAEGYRRAAELDGSFVTAWYNLGVALLHSGDRAGGMAMLGADGTRVLGGPAHGFYQRAVEAFSRAVALDPKHNRALVMRAFTHFNMVDDVRGRADLEAAVALGDPVAARELEKRFGK